MFNRFTIIWNESNGEYCIKDNQSGNEIYCRKDKLNETMWKLLGV